MSTKFDKKKLKLGTLEKHKTEAWLKVIPTKEGERISVYISHLVCIALNQSENFVLSQLTQCP